MTYGDISGVLNVFGFRCASLTRTMTFYLLVYRADADDFLLFLSWRGRPFLEPLKAHMIQHYADGAPAQRGRPPKRPREETNGLTAPQQPLAAPPPAPPATAPPPAAAMPPPMPPPPTVEAPAPTTEQPTPAASAEGGGL